MKLIKLKEAIDECIEFAGDAIDDFEVRIKTGNAQHYIKEIHLYIAKPFVDILVKEENK